LDNIDYKILSILADNQYHSGEYLAQVFSTSRAAVCKRIAKINIFLQTNTYNYLEIISITGKGYCLNKPFDYVCSDSITQQLQINHNINNTQIDFFPIIDSTNNYLINLPIAVDQYHICLAEQQTSGRGRNTINQKKSWHSPFGNNIYCSIAWHYQSCQNALLGLSLVAGITLAEILTELGCLGVQLKWPNDILINNKKVAGILTEIYGEPNGGCKLVIGFGLNVFNNYNDQYLDDMNVNINRPWTNIVSGLTCKSLMQRNNIITSLISKFIVNYQLFIMQGLDSFLARWHRYDLLLNKSINIDIAGQIKQGVYCGIDRSGALLVKIDGVQQVFHSGEVSIGSI
jgi:BirA family biotin operon repressor/biotin-[acetyl-CoA-carboxylase] ligase